MSEELIITIETSGRAGSAAVGRGKTLISEHVFSGFMRHGAELFPALEALLSKAEATPDQVQHCYITAGPGSFTGLRIAVTAAKMLSFAQSVKIVAADSMDVIAENINGHNECKPDCIATILDAKKNLFFAAVFDRVGGQWQKCFDTRMMTAEELLEWLKKNDKHNVGLLGEGLVYYADKFKSPFTYVFDESLWSAKASALLQVGRRMAEKGLFTDPLTLTPNYLRRPDAVVKSVK
jgi:tRNA threonylcarbamoyladenosine biosynthesis protein TsaB